MTPDPTDLLLVVMALVFVGVYGMLGYLWAEPFTPQKGSQDG